MRTNFFLILAATALFETGCDKSETGKPDCSLVDCMYQGTTLRLTYNKADTGDDLLFQQGSAYHISDLKVISDRQTNNVPTVEVDSTDRDNKIILLKNVGSGDALKLSDLPSDLITLITKPTSDACCSPNTITQLKINGQLICEPCADLDTQVISIKK